MKSDKELIEILSKKEYNKHIYSLFKELSSEEQNYIISKYPDSKSLNESIYRFINNLDIRPICQYCGGEIKTFRFDRGFSKFCSKSCLTSYSNIKRNSIKSLTNGIIKKYGVKNIQKLNKTKEKSKQTCLKKYGKEYCLQNIQIRDKIKNTYIKKYGVPYLPESIIKMNNASLKKYGTKYPTQSNLFWKNYNFEQAKIKENNTKKKNNSFNISKKEEICYNLLKEKYSDIIRQYRSTEYPFNCDFYIPSLNLYIEYQGSHYHCNHPFDENNINDINKLNELKEKANNSKRHQEGKLSQYDVIIYTWTDLDVRKRKTVKENNLNFIEFWNLSQVKEWINT